MAENFLKTILDSTQEFLEKIHAYSLHEKLPSAQKISSLAKKTVSVLHSENPSYRPSLTLQDEKIAGGLLDFRGQKEIPCVVVPDIHARADFIYNILNFILPKKISGLQDDVRIADALDKNEIRVVLVGDLLHSEMQHYDRWLLAYDEFLRGDFAGKAMKSEMREGLSAQMAVMECKCRWQENFHCLKGNHENIKNENGGGNFSFRKFAQEGEMVMRFMQAYYGDEVLDAIYDFEKSLPLAFCTENLFVSHAEPLKPLDEEAVINAPLFDEAILALTWTANDEASSGSVKKMLKAFCKPKDKSVHPVYIGGHRPVKGKFNLRQNGCYVQLHNPLEQNIAIVRADQTFDCKTQIVSVEQKNFASVRGFKKL